MVPWPKKVVRRAPSKYSVKPLKFRPLHSLVYNCLQGVAPSYLADDLCQTADVEARHRLRSASSPSLVVRRTRLSTYGDRAFPVAASRVWNSLPHHVTSRHVTVTACFPQSSEDPSLQTQFSLTILLCSRSDTRHYGHVNRCFYLLTIETQSPNSSSIN